MRNPIRMVIVGAGHRALLYADYAKTHPDEMQIVGVVDPDPTRRALTAKRFGFGEENCFESVQQLVAKPRIAEAVINGTMDLQHVQTTLPLLEAGYDVLLEKPIATEEAEVLSLLESAKKYDRKVMICHVLRYAPFYVEIRKRIENGEIGEVLNIQTVENVSYHHMAMGFVRGKWANQEMSGSSMLMAKCCHDLDLIIWMKGGVRPASVSSFGSLLQFRADKAPAGAGTRCLLDCPIEADCTYSAKKHYLDQNLWGPYVWPNIHLGHEPSHEEKLEILRTESPYGRCVWGSDNDVVDNQAVIVEFEDGSTATHNLVGATAKPCRVLTVKGTKGEIYGTMEDGFFVVRHPDPRAGHEYTEERIDINVSGEMHGGGDLNLVADFLSVLRGERPSISSTSLEKSVHGHQIGFAADRSRREKRIVEIAETH